MIRSLEERAASVAVEFVRAVAKIDPYLLHDDYFMDIGTKRIWSSWITGAGMTVADLLKEAGRRQEGRAYALSGKEDIVGYMMCEGDLYSKLYGYDAYQGDIYGDGDEAKKLYFKLHAISERYGLYFEWNGGALDFHDVTYTTIGRLLGYRFYDGERTDCPVVIVGPDGSTRTMLRVYAYGGLIRRLETGRGFTHLAESKSYPRYLGETYFSAADEKDRGYLRYMDENHVCSGREADYQGETLCQKLSYRLQTLLKDSYFGDLAEPRYLDLILKAAEKRFIKRGGDLGERRIQTAIVKQHMKKAPEDGWCVVDMEYGVKGKLSPSGRVFKPDIVVFDQDHGFGLIELKYADESTENLAKHYTDMRYIIHNEEAVEEITGELKRRSAYLWGYGLISDPIYQAMNAPDAPKLWQGFLFVGGRRENAVRFVKGLAARCEEIVTDADCRFAFFPYEEENSTESIQAIRLDLQSMQPYGQFTEEWEDA